MRGMLSSKRSALKKAGSGEEMREKQTRAGRGEGARSSTSVKLEKISQLHLFAAPSLKHPGAEEQYRMKI